MADARPLIARIQVEHGSSGSFGQSDTEGSGGGDRVQQQIAKNTGPRGVNATLQKAMHTTYKNVQKKASLQTLGISVSIASLLKQSQIFTSSLGAIFQLIGAMIDLFLAPLVKPVLIPFIKWMARSMPDWVDNAHEMLATLRDAIRPILEKIWSMIPQVAKDNMGYLIAFLAGSYFIKKLTGVSIIGIATKPITALATGIFMGLGLMLAPYLVAVVASLGTLLAALAPLAILGGALFLTSLQSEISLWQRFKQFFDPASKVINLGGSVALKSGDDKHTTYDPSGGLMRDTSIVPFNFSDSMYYQIAAEMTGNMRQYGGDFTGVGNVPITTNPADIMRQAVFSQFIENFLKMSKDELGFGVQGVKGLDQFLVGAFSEMGAGAQNQIIQRPFVNPFGQGAMYRFEIHLDRGELMGVNYAEVEIRGQSGAGTSGTGQASRDYGGSKTGDGSGLVTDYTIFNIDGHGVDNTFDPNNMAA